MRTNRVFAIIGLVLMVVVMLVVVGSALGQDGDQPPEEPEWEGVAEPEYVLAQPPYTMNYQGYLTDGSGSPLNGSYDLVFGLYDDALAGVMEWGPEAHNDVLVSKGLFQVVLGSQVVMYPRNFDEALFLDVQVDGTPVTPRQPLHTVPYAFGLVPGAEVDGDPEGSNAGFYVRNRGENELDYGIYAAGERYGLYAEEIGDGEVGIYSPDFVQAKGFIGNADTYWWYDANGMMSEDTVEATGYFGIENDYRGGVILDCIATGYDYFVLPLDVPGQLYGQNVRLEDASVYYRTTNSDTYISKSWVYKSTGAGPSDHEQIAYDNTNHNSTSATWYSIPIFPTSNYTLTSTSGSLTAVFNLQCANTAHDLYISGVRLRLGHTND